VPLKEKLHHAFLAKDRTQVSAMPNAAIRQTLFNPERQSPKHIVMWRSLVFSVFLIPISWHLFNKISHQKTTYSIHDDVEVTGAIGAPNPCSTKNP
jgi:hypothetical protein